MGRPVVAAERQAGASTLCAKTTNLAGYAGRFGLRMLVETGTF
jgi:hypothetical protein